MAKVTFSTEPVVCITIRGEETKESKEGGPLEDGGLVGRFLRFEFDNKIVAAKRYGYCGRGKYIGFYTAEDAVKIRAWLLKQGTKEKKE